LCFGLQRIMSVEVMVLVLTLRSDLEHVFNPAAGM
jgi:hypothetical protein